MTLRTLTLLISLAALPASGDPPPGEIERAILDLGAPEFETRERASAILWLHGSAAEASLHDATRGNDPEIRIRAEAILSKFRDGLSPERFGLTKDSSPDQIAQIFRYIAGDADTRSKALHEIIGSEKPDGSLLAGLWRTELDPNIRKESASFAAGRLPQVLPALIEHGDLDAVEALLETAAGGDNEDWARHYAAFLLLRGNLDGAINRGNIPRNDNSRPDAAFLPAILLRARGDLASALRHADVSGKDWLQEAIRVELGDWGELLRRSSVKSGGSSPTDLSRMAIYHRLAGNEAGAAAALESIREMAARRGKDFRSWPYVRAFLLNERPDEAYQMIVREGDTDAAFRFLSERGFVPEALALLKRTSNTSDREDFELDMKEANCLGRLGESRHARLLVDHWIRHGDVSQVLQAAETAAYLGWGEETFPEALKRLPGGESDPNFKDLVEDVFPEHHGMALGIWTHLRRKDASAETGMILRRLRDTLMGGAEEPVYESLLQEAAEPGSSPEARKARILNLAYFFRRRDRRALERRCLELAVDAADPGDVFRQLGDLESEEGRWEDADRRYRQSWEQNKNPALLYRFGFVQRKAGRDAEGRAFMEKAALLASTKDENLRSLAFEMNRSGDDEGARRIWDALLRTGKPRDSNFRNALEYSAEAAEAAGAFDRAARFREQILLEYNRDSIAANTGAYFSFTADIHACRGRAKLDAGNVEGAIQEARQALAMEPGGTDVPIFFVAELERRGRKTEADALYRQVRDLYETICRQYPGAAAARNRLAWMGARCGRDLEQSQVHAEKAVALDSDNTAYIDTLAEICFVRGDRTRAIALAHRCVALNADSPYLRKQLKRFETESVPKIR